jgi:hypothetical protein
MPGADPVLACINAGRPALALGHSKTPYLLLAQETDRVLSGLVPDEAVATAWGSSRWATMMLRAANAPHTRP